MTTDPYLLVLLIPGVVAGLTFHEFGHAVVALWFGDDTAKRQGRVTLNPLAHLDFLGTLLLFIVQFGWAKPVPVNPSKMKYPVLGHICVSLAGVAMNFILACLFLAGAVIAARTGQQQVIGDMLIMAVRINIILIAFNLIPLPPLDGFHVLRYAFPRSMQGYVEQMYRFGPIFLMILFLTGIGRYYLGPATAFLTTVISRFVGLFF